MQQPETTLIYWAPSRVRFNLTLILAIVVVVYGLMSWAGINPLGSCSPQSPSAPTASPGDGQPPEATEPQQTGRDNSALLLIVVGLGVGAYSWLTSPRQYRVYSDALIIMFGTPRRRTIHFSDIREVVSDRGFMGDPLRVYTMNRRRIPLQVREPEEMHRYLDGALADFRRAYPQYASPPEESEPGEPAPDVVESTAADGAQPASDVSAEPAPADSAPTEASAPAEPDPPPERSPRSRRRSLRDDASSDGDGDDNRPRIS